MEKCFVCCCSCYKAVSQSVSQACRVVLVFLVSGAKEKALVEEQ